MKLNKFNGAMKQIARPPSQYTKAEKAEIVKDFYKKAEQPKSKILDWINYNNKIGGTNTQPITEEEKQVAKDIETYQNPPEVKDKEILKLEKRIANAKGYIKNLKIKKNNGGMSLGQTG